MMTDRTLTRASQVRCPVEKSTGDEMVLRHTSHLLCRFSWTNAATRESRQSVYVSQGHEREMLGKWSPGPHVVGREAFKSMGRQVRRIEFECSWITLR